MADLIKVSLQGTLPGGEVMSVNPVFSVDTGAVISFAELTAMVTAINALTIPSGVKNMITTGCAWTGVRVEARTVTGTLEALAEGGRTTPVTGTGAGDKPFQTSMVLSLRTSTPGGRGRGRLYWPATGVTVQASSLRVSTSDRNTFMTDLKSYLTAVEGAVDASVDEEVSLAVWSRTAAAVHPVNSLLLGDILDTQRRRRDSVAESYAAVAWP